MPQTAAIVGAAAAVVGTVGSIYSGKKQADAVNKGLEVQRRAAERARAAEERRNQITQRRERLRMVNTARRQRASIKSGAVRQGGLTQLGASGVQGGLSIVGTRLGTGVGTQTALAATGAEMSSASAQMAQGKFMVSQAQNDPTAGIFAGISSLGGSLVNISDKPAFKTLVSRIT
jgi:hypothetical protein